MKLTQDFVSTDWRGSHLRFEGSPGPEVSDRSSMEGTSRTMSRLLSKRTIQQVEDLATLVPRGGRAKCFRKILYQTEEYKEKLGKTRIGDRGCNWREEGDPTGNFVCPSLKEAWTVYQKFGRQDWTERGSSGTRKVVPEELRCEKVTAKGERCSKKKKGKECFCTQHFNILKRTLIFT